MACNPIDNRVTMSTITEDLTITGMSCGHCVQSVKNALAETAGVTVETVEIGHARVLYDPSAVSHEAIVKAIDDVGFEVVEK